VGVNRNDGNQVNQPFEDGWCTMVEKMTVWRDKKVFALTTGMEVEV
jgi:hypothetical protein